MAIKKVNTLISDLLRRADQIETEGSTFIGLDELRKWAAALQKANDEGPDVIERGDF